MARINRAKAVLLDPAIRADYDAARQVRFGQPPVVPRPVPVAHTRTAVEEVETVFVPPTRDLPSATFPWPLILVLVPLVLILSFYVIDAIQVSMRPLPPRNTDIALAPITRPDIPAVALSAYTLAANQPPSKRVGDYVYSQTAAVMDVSPESSFLKSAGRRIQRAGATGDAQGWADAVLDLCRLAGNNGC
jgi:hypothetical protein